MFTASPPPPYIFKIRNTPVASSSRAEPSVHVDRRGRIRRWSTSCRQSDERSLSSPLLNPRGQQPNAWAEHHHHRRHPAAERALQVLRNRGSPFHCSPLPLHSRSLVPPRPTSSRGIRVAINLPWRARCQNAERRGLPAGPRAGGGGGGTGADRMGRETRELQEL